MTGRELAAALRPVEQHARAVLRFAEIADEAIRLEAGLGLATTKLAETTAALEAARAERARLEREARGLAGEIAAARAAAEQQTAERCAAMVAEAQATVKTAHLAARGWDAKAASEAEAHAARVAQWTAEATTLREHVDGLRSLAQRMAKAAEAVPR